MSPTQEQCQRLLLLHLLTDFLVFLPVEFSEHRHFRLSLAGELEVEEAGKYVAGKTEED